MLHTLENIIGKTKLFEILKNHLVINSCDYVSTDRFIAEVNDAVGVDLKCFWDSWLYGVGLPEIEYEDYYKYDEKEGILNVKLFIHQNSFYYLCVVQVEHLKYFLQNQK